MLPLESFPAHGIEIEAVDSPAWRAALEAVLLGTFGHLSLIEFGIAEDHDCLVAFQEVALAHAMARHESNPPLDHVYACSIDFLTDLVGTVDFVRANPAKLTSAGRFFKGARNQLRPQTALLTTFFMDEESLLTYRLHVAQELDLLELREDGRLYAAPGSTEFTNRPLVEQNRALLDVMLDIGKSACAEHFPPLADLALETIPELPTDAWAPTQAYLGSLMSRYLLRLVEGTAEPVALHPSRPKPVWTHSSGKRNSVARILEAVAEPLLQALNYAGIIDIGRRGEQTYVRATEAAPGLLGTEPMPEPGQLIIVNPDFEVVLFPEEGHLELLHRLCAFCERAKSEVTLHLRITRDSVQQAVLRGLDAAAIIGTLQRHCRVPLSQNIEYSIRTWANGVHPARIQTLHVLELPRAELADALLQLPELQDHIVRRLSPTAIALDNTHLGPEAEEALKQLGIHLM
jgi:hypothetical protein